MKIERLFILVLVVWAAYLSYLVISPPAKAAATISMSSCRSQTIVTTDNSAIGFTPVGGPVNNGTTNGIFFQYRAIQCPAGQVMNGVQMISNDRVYNGAWIIGLKIWCCSLIA